MLQEGSYWHRRPLSCYLVKLSTIAVKRGFWGNNNGKSYPIPCRVTESTVSLCWSLSRGTPIFSAPIPKKLLLVAIFDYYTAVRGCTATWETVLRSLLMSSSRPTAIWLRISGKRPSSPNCMRNSLLICENQHQSLNSVGLSSSCDYHVMLLYRKK